MSNSPDIAGCSLEILHQPETGKKEIQTVSDLFKGSRLSGPQKKPKQQWKQTGEGPRPGEKSVPSKINQAYASKN